MTEWQPIETIPQGEVVLVAHFFAGRIFHAAVVEYYDKNTEGCEDLETGWYISDGKNDPFWHRMQYMMTHWQPLPAPPK